MDSDFTAMLITPAQARARGVSRAAMRRALREGKLVPVRRGVYVDAKQWARTEGDDAARHALEVSALLLTVDLDAVGAGTSAARIHGIARLGPQVAKPELLIAAVEERGMGRNGYVLRSAALPARHRTRRLSTPVTTAARTVVDLARTRPFGGGVVAADSALHKGIVTVEELVGVLDDCRGWPGITRARDVTAFADPGAESPLESLSRVVFRIHEIPVPRTQVSVGPYRVDFLWDDAGVIGEADGLNKYAPRDGRTTLEIVRAEKQREEWLSDRGYRVVRWGWDDARQPARLAQRIRAALVRGTDRRAGGLPSAA